jgi:hypothetical protein
MRQGTPSDGFDGPDQHSTPDGEKHIRQARNWAIALVACALLILGANVIAQRGPQDGGTTSVKSLAP